jgi:hypothetical protein
MSDDAPPPVWEYQKLDGRAQLARFVLTNARDWLDEPLAVNWHDLNQAPPGRRALVCALYQAVCRHPIRYVPEKYDPDAAKQQVRTPTEVLHNPGEGTCLDLSLLFCGLCLACELIPWLVVVKGHALVAVSLRHDRRQWRDFTRPEWKRFLKGPVDALDDEVRAALAEGYLVLECTGFARGTRFDPGMPEGQGRDGDGLLPFEEALRAGRAQLECARRPFECAIDLAVAFEQASNQGWGYEPYVLKPPAGRRSATAQPRDTGVLPYLADRTVQTQMIESEVLERLGSDGGRPLVFLIEGDYGQGHDGLIRRIRQHDLPTLLALAGSPDCVAEKLVNLPGAGAVDFGRLLRLELAQRLGVRLPGGTAPAWSDLSARLRDYPGRFLFTSSYSTTAWEVDRARRGGQPDRVRQFLAAWEHCDDHPPDRAPIVCLKVIYEQRDAPGWAGLLGRFFPPANRQLADHLDTLDRELRERRVYPRLRAVRLPRLDGVRPTDLEDWQNHPLVKAYSREADFTARIESLFSGVGGTMPMSKVITALGQWLTAYAMEV